jgi:hypothetical protein
MKATGRTVLKAQYQRFCEAWRNEKRYQAYCAENDVPLDDGIQKLGRKPTFAMWRQALKNKAAAEVQRSIDDAAKKAAEKQVQTVETEWEDQ